MSMLRRIRQLFGGGQVRRYQAAAFDRLTSDWLSADDDIREVIRSDANTIRRRARQMEGDNPYVMRFLSLCEANIVGGDGYRLRMQVTEPDGRPDDLANRILEESFWQWSRRGNCDVTGRYSFADICRLAVRLRKRDGEVFIRLVNGYPGNRWRFAVQLIEAQAVPIDLKLITDNRRIEQGIELDMWSRPIAYYVESLNGEHHYLGKRYTRIPAAEIIHRYRPTSPNQLRAISELHPVMYALHMAQSYMEAELVAARTAACKGGFYEQTGQGGNPFDTANQVDGGKIVRELSPGQNELLPPGVKFTSHDPKHPTTEFDQFFRAILRSICSGLNASYFNLSSDDSQTNFSGSRQSLVTERDYWKAEQSAEIAHTVQPIFGAWLLVSLTAGAITGPAGKPFPVSKYEKFDAATWIARRWDWVDPLKDAQAMALKREHGWVSDSMVIAELGHDPDEVAMSLKQDTATAGVTP